MMEAGLMVTVNSDDPAGRGIGRQKVDDPLTQGARGSGDDYGAHRPTMPL